MNIYFLFVLITLAFSMLLLVPIFCAKEICKKHKQIFSTIIMVLFTGGGGVLYKQFGSPEIIPLLVKREEKLLVLKEKITTNSEIIKKDSKNLRAWLELGDSFMETSQYAAAANAYKQGILLSEGNPAIITAYARALIIDNQGNVTEEAKRSLDMALLLQPANEEVRYFLTLYKLQAGDTTTAMEEMKSLYKSLANESPVKEMIDRQIGRK